MMAGFMAVSSILVGRIFSGAHSAGKFVYLSTYMYQLESTLKSLTALSRPLQAGLIRSESMMKLLEKRATVVDSSAARPLVACRGDITFENVTFSYDERRFALNRLSLNCRAGTTTAFVGESG
jgi:ABC-type transport system involved in Fe-S cluster assembly fused permease/ATPase subunit